MLMCDWSSDVCASDLAIGVTAGDVEHARATGADPDARELACVRFGIEARVMEFEELAVEVDRNFAVPQQANDFQRFFEAADRLRERETVRHGVLGPVTAEAEVDAAFGTLSASRGELCEARGKV